MVIYEQIRFCEIKSNLNPHALSWYAEKEKASLSQGGLQTKPSSSAQTAAYLLNGDAPHNNHLRERLTFLAQELEKITADLPVWG